MRTATCAIGIIPLLWVEVNHLGFHTGLPTCMCMYVPRKSWRHGLWLGGQGSISLRHRDLIYPILDKCVRACMHASPPRCHAPLGPAYVPSCLTPPCPWPTQAHVRQLLVGGPVVLHAGRDAGRSAAQAAGPHVRGTGLLGGRARSPPPLQRAAGRRVMHVRVGFEPALASTSLCAAQSHAYYKQRPPLWMPYVAYSTTQPPLSTHTTHPLAPITTVLAREQATLEHARAVADRRGVPGGSGCFPRRARQVGRQLDAHALRRTRGPKPIHRGRKRHS
jgi:hypothetical protein